MGGVEWRRTEGHGHAMMGREEREVRESKVIIGFKDQDNVCVLYMVVTGSQCSMCRAVTRVGLVGHLPWAQK